MVIRSPATHGSTLCGKLGDYILIQGFFMCMGFSTR